MALQNQVVVVTGASSGFGEAIARRAAARGAQVVLVARSAGALERLAGEIGRDRALALPADVTSDADVAALARTVIERFGRADALVNNAGIGIMDSFAAAGLADLQEMVDINLYGAVRCTQAFLPHMLARRQGQIIMMSSLGGLIATSNMAFYCATKFALVGMSRSLMLELAGSGVRCALICPGVAKTGFFRRADVGKYARSTLLATTSAEAVAAATVRAIERRAQGEVIVPWYGRPLARAANALPGLSRLVLRLLG